MRKLFLFLLIIISACNDKQDKNMKVYYWRSVDPSFPDVPAMFIDTLINESYIHSVGEKDGIIQRDEYAPMLYLVDSIIKKNESILKQGGELDTKRFNIQTFGDTIVNGPWGDIRIYTIAVGRSLGTDVGDVILYTKEYGIVYRKLYNFGNSELIKIEKYRDGKLVDSIKFEPLLDTLKKSVLSFF